MTNRSLQYGAALVTLLLAIAVLNPLHWWMPTMLAMLLLAALFVIFCVFATFVILERIADERDEQHRAFAGRAAFLAGAALLVCGIIAEDLSHQSDPWLIIALTGMLIAKFAARLYSDQKL